MSPATFESLSRDFGLNLKTKAQNGPRRCTIFKSLGTR